MRKALRRLVDRATPDDRRLWISIIVTAALIGAWLVRWWLGA